MQVSTGGGGIFWWNPNGRELSYKSGTKMMTVDITMSPSFSVGKPRLCPVVCRRHTASGLKS
jgi:hypothetical protein